MTEKKVLPSWRPRIVRWPILLAVLTMLAGGLNAVFAAPASAAGEPAFAGYELYNNVTCWNRSDIDSNKARQPDVWVLGKTGTYLRENGTCDVDWGQPYYKVLFYKATSFNCGTANVTPQQVYAWVKAAGLPDEAVADVLADPCGLGLDLNKPPLAGPLVGTWRIKPLLAGGQWYARHTAKVTATGATRLSAVDTDGCNWQVGNPLYRNLKASGNTYTGERYLGPCQPAAQAWTPVSITVAADGRSFTENVTGYSIPLTWLRDPTPFDCGAGAFTSQDVVDWATRLGLSNAELAAWLDKPCGSATLVASVDGHETVPDQGKGDGKNGKCSIARDRVTGFIKLNGRPIEVGHATMTTSFCHDGKIVYNAGTDEAPHHATFQNPSATNAFFLSCSYTGSLDNDFAYGWTDDTKRGFFTSGTIGFTCSGPALALAITAGPAQAGVQFNKNGNAYLTATQTVWQDGRSEFHMGGRS